MPLGSSPHSVSLFPWDLHYITQLPLTSLYSKELYNWRTPLKSSSGQWLGQSTFIEHLILFFLPLLGDSDDEDDLPSLKSVKMANHVNKNSRKREKFLENVKKAHR